MIDKKEVGKRIQQIRFNKGQTLEAFGKLFGASKGNVQQWENGGSLPNKKRIQDISKIGNITVNELLYGKYTIEQQRDYHLKKLIELSEKTGFDVDNQSIREAYNRNKKLLKDEEIPKEFRVIGGE